MKTTNTTRLEYLALKTELGWAAVLASPAGLRELVLPQASRKKAVSLLNMHEGEAMESRGRFQDLAERLQKYFAGNQVEFNDELDLEAATVFQQKVWLTARSIPSGSVQSYGWIAQQIGQPGASRAVGQALGRNPLPLIIPCHRVITSSGRLGGFSGGLENKIRLLKLEGFVLSLT